MAKDQKISGIRFDKGFMFLTVGSTSYKIKLAEVSTKLASANDGARNQYKISPSGYGIHWAQLDEDLSIDGIIKLAIKIPVQGTTA